MLSTVDDRKTLQTTPGEALYYAMLLWGTALLMTLACAGTAVLLNWAMRGELSGSGWSWWGLWVGVGAGCVLVPMGIYARDRMFAHFHDEYGVQPDAYVAGYLIVWASIWLWAMTLAVTFLISAHIMPMLGLFLFPLAGIALTWPKGYEMVGGAVRKAEAAETEAETRRERRAASRGPTRQHTMRPTHYKARDRQAAETHAEQGD